MHGQTVKPVPRINASCAPGHYGDAPDSAAAVRPRSSDANPPSHYKRNVAPASARPPDYYNARMHAAQASHGGSAAVAGRAKILDGATRRFTGLTGRAAVSEIFPMLPLAFPLGEQFTGVPNLGAPSRYLR